MISGAGDVALSPLACSSIRLDGIMAATRCDKHLPNLVMQRKITRSALQSSVKSREWQPSSSRATKAPIQLRHFNFAQLVVFAVLITPWRPEVSSDCRGGQRSRLTDVLDLHLFRGDAEGGEEEPTRT